VFFLAISHVEIANGRSNVLFVILRSSAAGNTTLDLWGQNVACPLESTLVQISPDHKSEPDSNCGMPSSHLAKLLNGRKIGTLKVLERNKTSITRSTTESTCRGRSGIEPEVETENAATTNVGLTATAESNKSGEREHSGGEQDSHSLTPLVNHGNWRCIMQRSAGRFFRNSAAITVAEHFCYTETDQPRFGSITTFIVHVVHRSHPTSFTSSIVHRPHPFLDSRPPSSFLVPR
jgi:hypothetical protein